MWAAVRVLADAASSLPLHVYRNAGDGRERVETGAWTSCSSRPAPGTTQADLISSLMAHVLIYGNAYLAKYREAARSSSSAYSHPYRVRPELENGPLRFRYSPAPGPSRCSPSPTSSTSRA